MTILLSAFSMGLFAAIIPGPILVSGISSILSHDTKGLLKAIKLISISIFVEFFIAFAIVRGGNADFIPKWIFIVLAIIGAGLLIWLAKRLWNAQNDNVDIKKVQFSAWQMVGITVFNPMLWSLWSTVSMPLAVQLEHQMAWGGFWYVTCFLTGVFIGHSSIFVLVEIIQEKFLFQMFTKRLFQIVSFSFIAFAIVVLWNGITLYQAW